MKNFNLPQQKNIPTGQDSVYLLYGKLCPAKNGDDNFVTICEKITSKLNELPDDFELNDGNLKLIRNAIHYIVHNLRQVSEYGSEIDNQKKMIV
ncbi:MAG TPA: hypothetical protein P5052_04260 [Candidatus Paceibacterota bacterium]|jgi:hypothetical protein|nr:hypothetical protein [Candidatus Paceibacterota bacterium]HRZ29921.1 hypothetical protein [Candidatus Paceibacterota bacterium]